MSIVFSANTDLRLYEKSQRLVCVEGGNGPIKKQENDWII